MTLSRICPMLSLVCAIGSMAALAADPAPAAPDKHAAEPAVHFDPKIDAWMQGTIVALDATDQKLTVRGKWLPYASTYAQMLKEIADKTANIADPAQKKAREDEIRQSYDSKLAKAKTDEPQKEDDFHFSMPANASMMILDEKNIQNIDYLHQDQGAPPAVAEGKNGSESPSPVTFKGEQGAQRSGEKEAQAVATMKDFKIGDAVMVGYEKGIISANVAYAIVKWSRANAPK